MTYNAKRRKSVSDRYFRDVSQYLMDRLEEALDKPDQLVAGRLYRRLRGLGPFLGPFDRTGRRSELETRYRLMMGEARCGWCIEEQLVLPHTCGVGAQCVVQ